MSNFHSSLCTVFDAILSNINEILSINLSPNVVLFGDLSVYNKDSLSYSDGNDRPVVFVIIFLSQMILRRWSMFLFDSLTVTLTVLLC